jgi:hypothetical protein
MNLLPDVTYSFAAGCPQSDKAANGAPDGDNSSLRFGIDKPARLTGGAFCERLTK